MRTKAELVQKIDDDLVWRRRELTDFRALIQDGNVERRRSALIRAGVALLYAHWEGFVKCCGTHYLEFVAIQGKKASELRRNFLAVKLHSQLIEASRSKKSSAVERVIDYFCTKMDSPLKFSAKNVVDTKSNLSSSVLEEIIWTLGLNMMPFETKRKMIDSSLVERRNFIAHGQFLNIDVKDYLELHDEVIWLIDEFRTQLQNAAVTDAFLLQS